LAAVFWSLCDAMVFSYRKDISTHKQFYKGNYKIFIGFFFYRDLVYDKDIFLAIDYRQQSAVCKTTFLPNFTKRPLWFTDS
jgi:hypothetical protein